MFPAVFRVHLMLLCGGGSINFNTQKRLLLNHLIEA